jgi:hypothetical protein
MKIYLEKYYGLIPLILLCVFYTYKAIDFPIHDFSNYYFGGTFLANGQFNSTIYFPYEFNKAISGLGYSGLFTSYAPNTPFLALFFYPISFLPLATAKLVFNCISVLLFVYSVAKLTVFYKIKSTYLVLIPILFFVPIKNELLFGQVYFLLFFLLTEFILAYEKKQIIKAALFLSLAIFLKISPILLIFTFLFQKQLKPLFYTFGFCLLLLLFSIAFTGFDIWFFYATSVLSKASNGEIATAYVDNYQSFYMFIKRLFIYDRVENSHPFLHSDSLFLAIIFAFKIGILSLGYFISNKKSNVFFAIAYWILAMILLSPYGSTYIFILVLIPFLALLKSEISNTKKVIAFFILFLINNLPLSFFIEKEFPFSYPRMFLLIAFFIAFVVFIFQKSNWIKSIVFSVIAFLIGTFYPQEKPQRSENFLINDNPILVYDYAIKNNMLSYFYWNEKGINHQSINIVANSISKLELKDNQVFYKQKQLTFDKSNKLKPVLINNKTLLYLSDYDRGIGFYTLRKITIN